MTELKYDKDGLIPVVVQDWKSSEVLMVAWANEKAVELMKETGYTHFWSRSRKQLWKKGETSGHYQKIISIQTDCDSDTLLVRVEQTGVACHLGRPSCFDTVLYGSADCTSGILPEIIRVIRDRKENPSDTSYTCKLLKNENLMCKKLIEEATEYVLAVKDKDGESAALELADLIYHLIVVTEAAGTPLKRTFEELSERRQ